MYARIALQVSTRAALARRHALNAQLDTVPCSPGPQTPVAVAVSQTAEIAVVEGSQARSSIC